MSNSQKGKPLSEEHRRKISESMKGRTKGRKISLMSEETRRKISEALKGRTFSAEHRMNMSIAGKGRIFSEEHRRKLSIAGKGKKRNSCPVMKKITDFSFSDLIADNDPAILYFKKIEERGEPQTWEEEQEIWEEVFSLVDEDEIPGFKH